MQCSAGRLGGEEARSGSCEARAPAHLESLMWLAVASVPPLSPPHNAWLVSATVCHVYVKCLPFVFNSWMSNNTLYVATYVK